MKETKYTERLQDEKEEETNWAELRLLSVFVLLRLLKAVAVVLEHLMLLLLQAGREAGVVPDWGVAEVGVVCVVLPPPGGGGEGGQVRRVLARAVARWGVVRWDLALTAVLRQSVRRGERWARMWRAASCWVCWACWATSSLTSTDLLLTLPHLVVPTVRLRRVRLNILHEGVTSHPVFRAFPLLFPLSAPILKPNLQGKLK